MGTVARIVVEAADERAAAVAMDAAFARIREIEQRLSDYIDTSEARRLERAPLHKPVAVSADLYRVLAFGLALARETDGAFDPTLGRATRDWRKGAPQSGALPRCAAWRTDGHSAR
jgi:FAD:protein FMN transferase